MNKVTQSIYKKKVNNLENDVNALKAKKLYCHNIYIHYSTTIGFYVTLYTSNSQPFTISTLRQHLFSNGITTYDKAISATGWTYDDWGSGLAGVTGVYAPDINNLKLCLVKKSDTGTFVTGPSLSLLDTVVTVL